MRTGCGDCEATELWIARDNGVEPELLTRGREDADVTKTIAEISNPVFSPDYSAVYFVSAAWAVSHSIQKVNIRTKQLAFVIDGLSVKVIDSGPYRGMLLVERALIKFNDHGESLGRDCYLWLVSSSGVPLREIGLAGSSEATAFQNQTLYKRALRPNHSPEPEPVH